MVASVLTKAKSGSGGGSGSGSGNGASSVYSCKVELRDHPGTLVPRRTRKMDIDVDSVKQRVEEETMMGGL